MVYTVQDDRLIVLVLSVGKREDSLAYRLAVGRLQVPGIEPEGKI